VLAAGVGLACVGWSWGYMSDCRDEAASAAAEARECQSLAERITSASVVGSPTAGPVELTGAISSAADAAGLPEGSLQRIDPGAVRRTADGTQMERPVEISIGSATLEQAFVFLHQLVSPPNVLTLASLQMKAPDSSASDSDRWIVQTTLVVPISGDQQP